MAIRLRDGEGLNTSQSGDRARTIATVADVPPNEMPPEGGVGGAPTIGVDTHPDDAGLLCRALDVRPFGPNKSRVTATYATQRFGGGALARSTVDISGNKFTYSTNFELVTVKIPYAVLEPVEVNSGDTSSTIEVWRADTIQITESRLIVQVNWEIVGLSLATMRTFNAQNNKVHDFAGSSWLFTLSSIRPLDNTSNSSGIFEVNASWTEDLGTRRPASMTSDDRIKFPGGAGGLPYRGDPPANGFLRSPYTALGIVSGPTPTAPAANGLPEVFQYGEYSPDPDGYLSLGLPPGAIS